MTAQTCVVCSRPIHGLAAQLEPPHAEYAVCSACKNVKFAYEDWQPEDG